MSEVWVKPTAPVAVGFAPILAAGWARRSPLALVAALLPIWNYSGSSRLAHPLVHMDRDRAMAEANVVGRWFLRSRVAEALARNHYLHHDVRGGHDCFNLVQLLPLTGDLMRRRYIKADMHTVLKGMDENVVGFPRASSRRVSESPPPRRGRRCGASRGPAAEGRPSSRGARSRHARSHPIPRSRRRRVRLRQSERIPLVDVAVNEDRPLVVVSGHPTVRAGVSIPESGRNPVAVRSKLCR